MVYGFNAGKKGRNTYKEFQKRFKYKKNLAVKAYRIAKQVKGLINVEHKRFDYVAAAVTGLGTNPTAINLFNPAQGNAYNQRSGDEVKCSSLHLNLNFINATTQTFGLDTDPYAIQVRYMLVKWHDERAQVPLASDLLINSNSNVATISQYNVHPTIGKYTVLKDKRFTMSSQDWAQGKFCMDKIRLKNKLGHVAFGAGSTNVDSGGFYLFIWASAANSTVTLGNNFIYDCTCRIRYVDN